MTQFRKLNKATTKLITSTGALALIAGLSLALSTSAFAQDACVDGTGTHSLQCGDSAAATAFGATAIGDRSTASGVNATALGDFSDATGDNSTALGKAAQATAESAVAIGAGDDIGNSARAFSEGSIAIGGSSGPGESGALAGAVGSIAIGGSVGTTDGALASGTDAVAIGSGALATGVNSTALGAETNAAGDTSTAFGRRASATGVSSTALGSSANAEGSSSIALGFAANNLVTSGTKSIAIGLFAKSQGTNAIAIGSDTDFSFAGADAHGTDSIVIGADASDFDFSRTIVIGKGAVATEADQVILKSKDTFTILGNGDVGIGTAAPLGNLDINSGAADTTLLLNNSSAQWELKSKASTGRLNFKNLTDGGVPFKLGPSAVNSLLSVGTMANDLVEVRGELMVEGDVDVTGTLTTGGPTFGGGCDAVFGADYDLPSIEEHAKAMYANSYLPEIGPTAPNAAINVSERMGTMLNELEKAHIYIAQQEARLNRHEQEKQAMQSRLERQGTELELIKQQIALLMNP